jgi:hypothetical protein
VVKHPFHTVNSNTGNKQAPFVIGYRIFLTCSVKLSFIQGVTEQLLIVFRLRIKNEAALAPTLIRYANTLPASTVFLSCFIRFKLLLV